MELVEAMVQQQSQESLRGMGGAIKSEIANVRLQMEEYVDASTLREGLEAIQKFAKKMVEDVQVATHCGHPLALHAHRAFSLADPVVPHYMPRRVLVCAPPSVCMRCCVACNLAS